MKITLTSAEAYDHVQQAWKKMGAPCHLRKTPDPLVAAVSLNKGADPVFANLFLAEQTCSDEKECERLKGRIYKAYFNSKIREWEEQLEQFRS